MSPLGRAVHVLLCGIGRRIALLLAVGSVALLASAAALANGIEPSDTYQSTVASDTPAAEFRLDDPPSSSTLADSAGTYTATNEGIGLGSAGPFDGASAGTFAGAAYAGLPSNPLSGATAFTAEAWVNWTGSTSYEEPIFDIGTSATNHMSLTPASAQPGHPLRFALHTTSSGSASVTTETLAANAWMYVAVTETSSGTVTLYVNGKEEAQVTEQSVIPASLGSEAAAYLGKSSDPEGPLFTGQLSNVAFYTSSLSQSQIEGHYDAGEFPVNTALPTIAGTPREGEELTAHVESWTGLAPIEFFFQWKRCNVAGGECTDIASGYEEGYRAGGEDLEKTLRVEVMAYNPAGTGNATSEPTSAVAASEPVSEVPPAISGVAWVGETLSVDSGTWAGASSTYAYQWEECDASGEGCEEIGGATTSEFVLTAAQLGKTIRANVTAENDAGSSSATSEVTAVVAPAEVAPVSTGGPTITGSGQDGQTLTASNGTWTSYVPPSFSYQWQSCNSGGSECQAIEGATQEQYVVDSGDLGTTLRVIVTAENPSGTEAARSAPTEEVIRGAPSELEPPTISGDAQVGEALSADAGTWGGRKSR